MLIWDPLLVLRPTLGQQRRDLEQQKMEELRAEMSATERDFATEVQKRMEVATSLQTVTVTPAFAAVFQSQRARARLLRLVFDVAN